MITTNGVTWHAIVQQPEQFEATKALLTGTFGVTPAVDVPGFVMIPFPDGTMLELYAPQAVPAYGYNDGIAIGFRVDDVETASQELAAAGAELLGEITRMSDINYAYRHFRGPDGRVYGINESKPQPAQGGTPPTTHRA